MDDLWPERPYPLDGIYALLLPYYRDPRILDEGLTTPQEKRQFEWLSDYALCAWGPGGKGTLKEPYWRWPGAPSADRSGPRVMTRAEVLRPTEALQFADGLTLRYDPYHPNSFIRRRHRNGLLNGAFLDGHARAVTDAEWNRVGLTSAATSSASPPPIGRAPLAPARGVGRPGRVVIKINGSLASAEVPRWRGFGLPRQRGIPLALPSTAFLLIE